MQAALSRARNLLQEGHQIAQVFFYGPSVLLANRLVVPGSNCPDFCSEWRSLAQQYEIPLVACSSIGRSYGLVAEQQDNNIADGFTAGGLSEFISLLAEVDHVEQH